MTDYYDRLRRQYVDPLRQQEDKPLTVMGTVGDLVAAPFRGAAGAVQGTYHLLDWATGDFLPDWETPMFGESETIAGQFVETLVQFALPYGALSRTGKFVSAARKLGLGNRGTELFKAATQGAVVDAVAFDHEGDNLSAVIQQFPGLRNPITDYLASEEEDGFLERRLKGVLEGALLGTALDSATMLIGGAVRAMKKGDSTIATQAVQDALDPQVGKIRQALNVTTEEAQAIAGLAEAMKIDPESLEWVRGGEMGEGALEQALRPSIIPVSDFQNIRAALEPGDEGDEYLYHVTTRERAEEIIASGFRQFPRESSMAQGFYSEYSRGKVFFTEADGLDYWETRIREHLESQSDEEVGDLVALRISADRIEDLGFKVDELGTRDAKTTAYYYDGGDLPSNVLEQTAYHGSPHKFDAFSTEKIGAGEGHQAYGWGLYFAENKGIAEWYKRRLARPAWSMKIDGQEVDVSQRFFEPNDLLHSKLAAKQYAYIHIVRELRSYWSARVQDLQEIPKEFLKDVIESKIAQLKSNIRKSRNTRSDLHKEWEMQLEAHQEILQNVDSIEISKTKGSYGYEVELAPTEDEYLDLDALIEDQSPKVLEALQRIDGWEYIEERIFNKAESRGENPTGMSVLDDLSQELDPASVSKLLLSVGIRGNRYWDHSSRSRGQGTRNYVLFDDGDVKITSLFQGPKGSVEFLNDGRTIIRGFQNSDFSTGVHELAHVARRRILNRSLKPDERLGITDLDIETAEKWAGVENGEWTREAEEKFARGLERYIRDGQAPDSSLEKLFKSARDFMLRIYERLTGSGIDVKISPEMREVFDKLVTRSVFEENKAAVDLASRITREIEEFSPSAVNPRDRDPVVRAEVQATREIDEDYLNLSRYDSDDEAVSMVRAVERAVRSSPQARQFIDRIDTSSDTWARMEATFIDTLGESAKDSSVAAVLAARASEDNRALRQALFNGWVRAKALDMVAADNVERWRKVASGQATMAQANQFTRDAEVLKRMIIDQANLGRGFGQGLQSFKKKVYRMTGDEQAEWLKKLNAQSVQELAGTLVKAYDAGGLGKVRQIMEGAFQKNKWWNVLHEFRLGALLYGPATQIVSISGGAMQSLWQPLEKVMGVGLYSTLPIKDAAQKEARQRIKDFLDLKGGLALETIRGYATAAIEGAKMASLAGKTGESIFTSTSKLDGPNERYIRAGTFGLSDESKRGKAINALGAVMNLPFRGLQLGDEFFKQYNGRIAMRNRLLADNYRRGLRGENLHAETEKQMFRLLKEGQLRTRAQVIEDAERAAMKLPNPPQTPEELDQFVLEYVQENFDPSLQAVTADPTVADVAVERARISAEQSVHSQALTRDRNAFITAAKGLQEMSYQVPFLRMFVPFIKTPANMMDFAFGRTAPLQGIPVAVSVLQSLRGTPLEDLSSRLIRDLRSNDLEVATDAAGRMASSIAVMVGAWHLVGAGKITGTGPANPEERSILMQSGWQPMSILVGDDPSDPKGYVSYARMDPLATIVGLYADLGDALRLADSNESNKLEQAALGFMTALSKSYWNKTYLQGMSDLITILSDGQASVENKTRSLLASSLIPNVFRQATAATDPIRRSNEAVGDPDFKSLERLINDIRSRIPWTAPNMEPQRNLLGEPIRRPAEGWQNMISPMLYSVVSDDIVTKELGQLYHGFQPPRAQYGPLDLRDYTNARGQSAYDRWMQLTGEITVGGDTLKQALKDLIRDPGYQRIDPLPTPDGEKSYRVALIRRVINVYRDRARLQMLREYPEVASAIRQVEGDRIDRRLGRSNSLQSLLQ